MIQVVISGAPVFPSVCHINTRAAERYAARRLNDPRRRATALPHFPRKTWVDAGYRVEDVAFCEPPRVAPAAGHVCVARPWPAMMQQRLAPRYAAACARMTRGRIARQWAYWRVPEDLAVDLEFAGPPVGESAEEACAYGDYQEAA